MLSPAAHSRSLSSCFCETCRMPMPLRLSPCVALGWNGQSRHTHGTWLQDCCFVRKSGKMRVSLPAGNFCFDFQLPLFYGPLSPHQHPLPCSLLFFLFSVYILASISTSWCDVYSSNECRVTWLVAGIDPPVITLLLSPSLTNPAALWHSVSLTLMACLHLALYCAFPTLIWVFFAPIPDEFCKIWTAISLKYSF